jgi:hypothetical protein
MTRSITYSEKAIGWIQILWGTFGLFVAIYGLKNLYDFGVTYFQLTLEKISIWKILKTYHFGFLLAILSLISGLLLILKKNSGWQLAIITSFVTGILGAINLIYSYSKPDKLKFNQTNTILQVTIMTVFLLITFILLLKPFRTKYNPTRRTWWTSFIIVALLLMDKIIFQIMK